MYICPTCGRKYMLPLYEGSTHIFLRCPNKECGNTDGRRKQTGVRGRIVKRNGCVVETNIYDGEIKE